MTPTPSRWETNIPNRLPALMQAIQELDRFLEQWGAESNARFLAQLAAEELGTNIIKYGYDDTGNHTILLSVAAEEHLFRICLEDDGHEFNPCSNPEPDPNLALEERAPGGWGIGLVRRLLPGMEYERKAGRNVVCVKVPRSVAPPAS